jgi:hypothetical protein
LQEAWQVVDVREMIDIAMGVRRGNWHNNRGAQLSLFYPAKRLSCSSLLLSWHFQLEVKNEPFPDLNSRLVAAALRAPDRKTATDNGFQKSRAGLATAGGLNFVGAALLTARLL